MISCLDNRRTSILANGRWLARPWDETSHSLHPRVYDKGFALAALLQEIENADLASADTDIPTLSHCLQCGIDMDTDLDEWYEQFLIRSPSPLYWPAPPSFYTALQQNIAESGPRELPLLSFPKLEVAISTVNFWALKLILSNEIASICRIILSSNRADLVAMDNAASLTLSSMAQRAENQHSHQSRIDFATDIVRSMPYCLNHNMGLLGPEKCFFPLRTALATLQRHPGPELEWCRAVYRRMDNRSGLRGVMQLQPYLYPCESEGDESPHPSSSHDVILSASEPDVETCEEREEPIKDCLFTRGWKGLCSAFPRLSIAS